MRLIQRETQLEHLVIDGQWTLLVVLDDVRVGDIIEAAYSFLGGNPIRPGGCELFFAVPPLVVVGNFRVSVQFAEATELSCLTSSDAPARVEEKLPSGRVRWSWQGHQFTPREEEPNQPTTFLDCIWVQVTDLPAWQPLSARLAEVWNEVAAGIELLQLPGLARPSDVNAESVHQLIRYLQEEFRYLSVDLEGGGWIPANPVAVARRRYGDCKDLVWLAASVLRQWGVTARPILVAAGLRERIQDFRPTASLFNHAVLEVEMDGQARWFDLTQRHQGGDFATQPVPWFGVGLPVQGDSQLRPQPGRRSQGLYAIRETIDLDTRRGEPSLVEIRVCAEGWNADFVRAARMTQGPEEFAKDRLAQARRRYGKAERIGPLEWRDDRARNVCELAEIFEIHDVTHTAETDNRVIFDVPINFLIQTLVVPDQKHRRGPWDLPRMFESRHEICIKGRTLGAGPRTRRRWVCPEFTGTLEETRLAGSWKKISCLSITADAVSVDRITEYRRLLDQFLVATTWRLYLPRNVKREASFPTPAKLPEVPGQLSAYVPAADLNEFTDATEPPNVPVPPVPGPAPADSFWTGPARYLIPLLLLVVFGGARSWNSTSDRMFSPPSPPPATRYLPPSDPIAFFEKNKTAPNLLPSFEPNVMGAVYDSQSVDHMPEVISQTLPKYPASLLASGTEGEALIEFVVTSRGIPARIRIVKATNHDFGVAAVVAVSQWRFRPATKEGREVNVAMQAPFSFKLEK